MTAYVSPRVTVLMPMRNAASFLAEAIMSILSQTYTDFEFLIIDDGSTDTSVAIIKQFRDSRIRLVVNDRDLGLVSALNYGLELARGEYVARMDADDISLPVRLERQVSFMDANPMIGVCGSWIETFGISHSGIMRAPVAHDVIVCRLLFESVLFHPTIMLRKELFQKHGLRYSSEYLHAEDFDLWVRAAQCISLANIAEVLLKYRLHPHQVGMKHNKEQIKSAGKVSLNGLRRLQIYPAAEELELHQSICRWSFEENWEFVNNTEKWFLKLVNANMKVKYFPEPTFSVVIFGRWFEICVLATKLGPRLLKKVWLSPLFHLKSVSWLRIVAFSIKCLLGIGRRGQCKN